MCIVPSAITIVLYPGKAEEIMPRKRKIRFILEAIIVFVFVAALSSIAVPEIEQMINNDQEELRVQELNDIQGAVAEMLADSPSGSLIPVGPTRDMEQVRTSDAIPLILENYLSSNGDFTIKSDCYYIFTIDGQVTQNCP
jgi:hypothetical protein